MHRFLLGTCLLCHAARELRKGQGICRACAQDEQLATLALALLTKDAQKRYWTELVRCGLCAFGEGTNDVCVCTECDFFYSRRKAQARLEEFVSGLPRAEAADLGGPRVFFARS
jgi:hypothetical protein